MNKLRHWASDDCYLTHLQALKDAVLQILGSAFCMLTQGLVCQMIVRSAWQAPPFTPKHAQVTQSAAQQALLREQVKSNVPEASADEQADHNQVLAVMQACIQALASLYLRACTLVH